MLCVCDLKGCVDAIRHLTVRGGINFLLEEITARMKRAKRIVKPGFSKLHRSVRQKFGFQKTQNLHSIFELKAGEEIGRQRAHPYISITLGRDTIISYIIPIILRHRIRYQSVRLTCTPQRGPRCQRGGSKALIQDRSLTTTISDQYSTLRSSSEAPKVSSKHYSAVRLPISS